MATTVFMHTTDSLKRSASHSDHAHCCKPCTPSPVDEPKVEPKVNVPIKQSFNESQSMKNVRLRGLSHWPHTCPSHDMMAAAGWFSCSVGDRVLCIYCNTICQEWTVHDDPFAVHTRFAPQCPFVLSVLSAPSLPIVNETLSEQFDPTHPVMASIYRRQETFAKTTWPADAPSVDELVRCGFFYSGTNNAVTCFNCNGSLHRWGPKDNPMIEHVRWFPNCIYAKHLCGDKFYQRIQATKKRQSQTTTTTQNKFSDAEVKQMVSARMDLPVAKRLQTQYRPEIVKRCLEDQLKTENDDFAADIDFTIACLILKKQIEHIKGCKDNISIPSRSAPSTTPTQPSKSSLGECLVCLTEEKQLACMPCGHLCACVPCGYALRTCPVCRQDVQCFKRITC